MPDLAALYEDALDAEEDARFDRALDALDDLLSRDPDHAEGWKLRTRILLALDRLDDAFANAAQAADRFPKATAHRLAQARIHIRRHDWDRAEAAYRAILDSNPVSLNAIRELMDFVPVAPDDPIAATLQAHHDDPKLKPYDQASTVFLLAQIHMNAGQDDTAFALFDEGNRRMRTILQGQRMEYGFSRLLPEFDAAFQRRHARTTPPDPCPLMVVAGLPRSGKSLVEKLLSSQPSVLAGGETGRLYKLFLEVDRTRGADAAMLNLLRPPVSPLLRYFRTLRAQSRKPDAQRVIDTTPGNLEQLAFLGPMHPDVPVILVRRDPRDLVAAMYFKQFTTAHRYTYDLGTAARAVARSEFLMRRWRDTLPNPVVEVTYEETVNDPVGTATRLLGHCGLPADPARLAAAAVGEGRQINLSPGRSLDGMGAVSPDLAGFSGRFAHHLAGVTAAYDAECNALN